MEYKEIVFGILDRLLSVRITFVAALGSAISLIALNFEELPNSALEKISEDPERTLYAVISVVLSDNHSLEQALILTFIFSFLGLIVGLLYSPSKAEEKEKEEERKARNKEELRTNIRAEKIKYHHTRKISQVLNALPAQSKEVLCKFLNSDTILITTDMHDEYAVKCLKEDHGLIEELISITPGSKKYRLNPVYENIVRRFIERKKQFKYNPLREKIKKHWHITLKPYGKYYLEDFGIWPIAILLLLFAPTILIYIVLPLLSILLLAAFIFFVYKFVKRRL